VSTADYKNSVGKIDSQLFDNAENANSFCKLYFFNV